MVLRPNAVTGYVVHGLINTAIESFVIGQYGSEAWKQICQRARLGHDSFESMMMYEDADTLAVLDAAFVQLGRDRDSLLEDLGTWLVTSEATQPVRRLLRFGGETFPEFLHSLCELHDRARLAMPDMSVPVFSVREYTPNTFSIRAIWVLPGFGALVLGLLRAMADDFGALVVLSLCETPAEDGEIAVTISVDMLDSAFAEGRDFVLGARQ